MSSPSIPGKMEAKPLFNVQKALVQPVQMCMLDIPLSVQDDDVSTRQGSCRPGAGSGTRRVCEGQRGAVTPPRHHPGVVNFWQS